MKRTGKFYRKNEKEVMKQLGITATYNSGSGWLEKEDGQSEYVICQLKSTDSDSFRVGIRDINILESNARVAHKVPLFIVQFLKTNDLFALMRLEDIPQISEVINTGCCEIKECIVSEKKIQRKVKVVKSGNRENFWNEKEREREKWQKKSK